MYIESHEESHEFSAFLSPCYIESHEESHEFGAFKARVTIEYDEYVALARVEWHELLLL